jgi:hypothetical protein
MAEFGGMDEHDFLGFVSALGEELCGVLEPLLGFERTNPQDGYEIFLKAMDHEEPSPKRLAALTDQELGKLRDACRSYKETDKVTLRHIRDWVAGTLQRWPADE